MSAYKSPYHRRTLILSVLAVLLLVGVAQAALPGAGAFQETPTPTYPFEGTYTPPAVPPPMPVPPPVPLIAVDNDAIENILLLGSDSPDDYYRRTDVMILLSINKQAGTAAMWHIPRATWVYIPNNTMERINTAFAWGASNDYPGGAFGNLKDLFRYNFGIVLDHYARVNFTEFMKLIEWLGGLDISVDCALQDWRLKDPELDPGLEDSWENYTLSVGLHHLSPYMALWYVRSRQTTDDLDRGRRQMDVLRAIWQQVTSTGLISNLEALWPQISAIVDTDMTLTDVLSLAPLATTIDLSRVARYGGTLDVQYEIVYTPDNGREVLVPLREALLPMLQDFLTPPTGNRLGRAAVTVDIADATWWNMGLARVAADRLAWEGFAARPIPGIAPTQREGTVIYDYTGGTKASPLPDLQRLLRVSDSLVIAQPDPNRTVDFRVEIGTAYNSCVYGYAEDELPPVQDDGPCQVHFRAQVNVRLGPGTDYPVLDVATPNDVFPIDGQSADSTWWHVDADGTSAWVSSEISTVRASGQCDALPVMTSGVVMPGRNDAGCSISASNSAAAPGSAGVVVEKGSTITRPVCTAGILA